jgi:hypothetical protein
LYFIWSTAFRLCIAIVTVILLDGLFGKEFVSRLEVCTVIGYRLAVVDCRSANLLNIERLLLIAERYIISVEELHTAPRSILPHGASFHGLPLNLNIICEAHKREFVIQVIINAKFNVAFFSLTHVLSLAFRRANSQ